jgi:shikimate dehydrogenase
VRAVREEFQADIRDLRVLILGAGGGAGRAIAVQCAMEGCQRLVLANRTVEKAQALAGELATKNNHIVAIPCEDKILGEQLTETDLVINATSVGMKDTDAAPIPTQFLKSSHMVYDTVYSTGKSRLVSDAEAAGARAANGLSMLLHQGALSFEIWFQRPAPLEAMRRALMNG